MAKAGLVSATSGRRVLARVYAMLVPALDDTDLDKLLWMPAHKGAAQVGYLQLSNGDYLTEDDVMANGLADKHAKEAVEEHRVTRADVTAMAESTLRAKDRAMWLARVTVLANNSPNLPETQREL